MFVVWAPFQRRAETIAAELGMDLRYFPSPTQRRWLKGIGYLSQSYRTFIAIVRAQPQTVWFQHPPNFLVLIGWAAQAVLRRRIGFVADCHNASMRSPWRETPLTRAALRQASIVVVHNDTVIQAARNLGVEDHRIVVLEDPPMRMIYSTSTGLRSKVFALVPCSFHDDEPIEEVLGAARLCPAVTFVLTGDLKRLAKRGLDHNTPDNVEFPGFLPEEDFNELIATAGVVVGLTKLEGVQLSVATEGLGACRPMVLSDTATLRQMFGPCAIFTSNSPTSIAASIIDAIARGDELVKMAQKHRSERLTAWREKIICLQREHLAISS